MEENLSASAALLAFIAERRKKTSPMIAYLVGDLFSVLETYVMSVEARLSAAEGRIKPAVLQRLLDPVDVARVVAHAASICPATNEPCTKGCMRMNNFCAQETTYYS
jgi:hypothetical protein